MCNMRTLRSSWHAVCNGVSPSLFCTFASAFASSSLRAIARLLAITAHTQSTAFVLALTCVMQHCVSVSVSELCVRVCILRTCFSDSTALTLLKQHIYNVCISLARRYDQQAASIFFSVSVSTRSLLPGSIKSALAPCSSRLTTLHVSARWTKQSAFSFFFHFTCNSSLRLIAPSSSSPSFCGTETSTSKLSKSSICSSPVSSSLTKKRLTKITQNSFKQKRTRTENELTTIIPRRFCLYSSAF
jgi:hypothetical protein